MFLPTHFACNTETKNLHKLLKANNLYYTYLIVLAKEKSKLFDFDYEMKSVIDVNIIIVVFSIPYS